MRLSDAKFDGVVTVGDLYGVLCRALKISPLVAPTAQTGIVRMPQRPTLSRGNTSAWSREYRDWPEFPWTPEDVWATLVSIIVDVNQLGESPAITPETILLKGST